MAVKKSGRLELRTDETTDQLITHAAALLHMSKTAFVTDAARQVAERVVGRADVTLMSPEAFEAMVASLGVPDESLALETKSRLPRLIQR